MIDEVVDDWFEGAYHLVPVIRNHSRFYKLDINDIKLIHELFHAGMMNSKNAIEQTDGHIASISNFIRKRGIPAIALRRKEDQIWMLASGYRTKPELFVSFLCGITEEEAKAKLNAFGGDFRACVDDIYESMIE